MFITKLSYTLQLRFSTHYPHRNSINPFSRSENTAKSLCITKLAASEGIVYLCRVWDAALKA